MDHSAKRNRGKSVAACLILFILLVALLTLTLTSCDLFSTEIYLNYLHMDIEIEEDGSIFITEKSEAYFTEQDTDWWNFYRVIDDDRARDIGIVTDEFYVDGRKVTFVPEPLDLDAHDSWYWKDRYSKEPVGYCNYNGNGLEIGAILPEFTSGLHTFKYSYRIANYMTGVSDAAVFYHQYISEINSMDVKELTVTVTFPQAEKGLSDTTCWLHVSRNAVGVWKLADDDKSVSILVEDISAGEYVESRMLLDKTHYTLSSVDTAKSSATIMAEEEAEKAAYEKEQRLRLFFTILDYVLAGLAVLFGVLMVIRFKKKARPLELDDKPIYYRDIPEGYTGGEVSPLYFYYSNENYIDESISATMLELVRKGYISIVPDVKAKSARVTVLKQDENDEIPTHQKYVIEMLTFPKAMGESFTMKELEKYGKNNPGKMMNWVDKYRAAITNKSKRDGAYPKKNTVLDKVNQFVTAMVGFGIAVVFLSGVANFFVGQGMFFFGIGLLLGALVSFVLLRNIKTPLTVYGQREYDKLHALGKYMQEFSMMEEHEIPELVMWEDYMIFATAMGIADKVAKQLEIAYPEFKTMSESSFDTSGLLILYFFSPSFRVLSGLNFIGNVSNVMRSVNIAQRAMRAGQIAGKIGGIAGGSGGSGFHGGGGGFSGGGFGGRR